jgi:poly-beta-1,6-N-acetyl-D-glucosamine synthase
MTVPEVLFWGSLGLVGYTYVGYPGISWTLARLRPRPVRTGPITPTMTVLIAAHNEEAGIGAKLENLLELDYPPDRLDLVVVSDGSTDRTPALVEEYASQHPGRVTLVAVPERQGKASALNTGAAHASGDILLLADARQGFDRAVARALARHFADPEVGAVSGELILMTQGRDGQGAGLDAYWRYEKWLRQTESRWGSSMGYTGAVSAIRRSLFRSLPPDTLVDDLVVPLRVIAGGLRVVFEPGARAFDRLSPIPGREFSRKVRTLVGVLQTCIESRRFVGPLGAGTWCQLLSHKLSRLAVPYALAAILLACALSDGLLYRTLLVAQALTYALGVSSLVFSRDRVPRLAAIPAAFLMLNAAAVVAAFGYFTGRRLDLWRRPVSSGSDRGGRGSEVPAGSSEKNAA